MILKVGESAIFNGAEFLGRVDFTQWNWWKV